MSSSRTPHPRIKPARLQGTVFGRWGPPDLTPPHPRFYDFTNEISGKPNGTDLETAKSSGGNVLFRACLAFWALHSSLPDDSIICLVVVVARQLPKAADPRCQWNFPLTRVGSGLAVTVLHSIGSAGIMQDFLGSFLKILFSPNLRTLVRSFQHTWTTNSFLTKKHTEAYWCFIFYSCLAFYKHGQWFSGDFWSWAVLNYNSKSPWENVLSLRRSV